MAPSPAYAGLGATVLLFLLGGLDLGGRRSLFKLIHAPSGINNFGLTGVERMRGARDFYLEDGVLCTVVPLAGFGRLDGRANQKTLPRS